MFTETVTTSTKRKIFELFDLDPMTTHVIQHEPIEENLRFLLKHIAQDEALENIFKCIIEELKNKGTKMSGTLIFCRTRKQCAAIYQMFVVCIGNRIYRVVDKSPSERIVEMFNAGTPKLSKNISFKP